MSDIMHLKLVSVLEALIFYCMSIVLDSVKHLYLVLFAVTKINHEIVRPQIQFGIHLYHEIKKGGKDLAWVQSSIFWQYF